jgi:hypothetical protein
MTFAEPPDEIGRRNALAGLAVGYDAGQHSSPALCSKGFLNATAID